MSSIIIPRKWQTQPQYRVEVNRDAFPGKSQILLPSLNMGAVSDSGILTLSNPNTPFSNICKDGVALGWRPNTSTAPGECYHWDTGDFNIGSNASAIAILSLMDNGYAAYVDYGDPLWGLALSIRSAGVEAMYVDNPVSAGFKASLSATIAVGQYVAVGLVKSGNTISVYYNRQKASTTGGNGGIRRSAGSGFGYGYNNGDLTLGGAGSYGKSPLAAFTSAVIPDSRMFELLENPWRIFRKQSQVLYFDVGGGATIAPTPGSTVVAGFAPTISQPQTVAPGVGAEVYAGQVPSIAQAVSITPTDGAVSFAGSAPTISQPQVVTPGVGAEVYAGQVPSIAQAVSIIPTDGAVTFAGSVPVIGQSRTVVVGTVISRPDGTIDATGFTPVGAATIHECLNEVTPDDATYIVGTSDAVSVSLQDIADPGISTGHVVRFRAKADSGWVSVVLLQGAVEIASKYSYGTFPSTWTDDSFTLTTGQADSITDYTDLRLAFAGLIGNVYYSWVEFSVAQFPLVVPLGYAPSIAQAVSLTPTAGTVSFAGSAPTISQPQTVAPGVGAEVYAGQVPEISQAASVRPDVGAVSFAGSAPTISQPQTVTTVTGSVLLEGLAPAVTQGVTVSPGAGSEVVLGYVPTLTQGASVQPVDGAVSFAGFEPAISQPHTIITVTGAYAILGAAPTVTQAAIISPTDGAVDVDGYIPAIAQPRTITTVTGVATWLGFTPGIGSPVEFAKYLAGVRVYHTDADAVVKHTTSDVRVAHTTSSVRV